MQKLKIESFQVIGITVRTTNEAGQSAQDIPALWGKFMNEGIAQKIPNKIDNDILCLYSNYEEDHTKGYDTILGCRVSTLEEVPEGMSGHSFDAGKYNQFEAMGDLQKGAVYTAWTEIWKKGLNRTYSVDFEVYGEKAQDPTDATVDIFVAIDV